MRSTSWQAIGTTVDLLVTVDEALSAAAELLREELAALDVACSRFRADSELRRLRPGRQRINPVLAGALRAALDAAEQTHGLVDPTLGRALQTLGYDRTFTSLPADGPTAVDLPEQPGRWREIALAEDEVTLPPGVLIDLGATAKAWAADRAAARIRAELRTGVLVNLGGDLAVAGPIPVGGWPVGVDGSTVSIRDGGLATSSTQLRTWLRGGRRWHHVLDPRTGRSAVTPWSSVTVAAATCLEANTASTAAIVLGNAAPQWLADRGLPARLVGAGRTVVVGGWPLDVAA